MGAKMMMRPYCLVGLGNIKGIKEDLQFISETESNFVCGDNLLIATFMSTLRIGEMEEFFKMNERSFILFELTPGFFSANIENQKFQKALFGGIINNIRSFPNDMENDMLKFMDTIKEELEEDMEELQLRVKPKIKEDPTLDELLDKINDVGVERLTIEEKELLHKYSI